MVMFERNNRNIESFARTQYKDTVVITFLEIV